MISLVGMDSVIVGVRATSDDRKRGTVGCTVGGGTSSNQGPRFVSSNGVP